MTSKRKQLYDFIIEHNLQEEVKNKFGKNYTVLKNTDLDNFISNYKNITESNKSNIKEEISNLENSLEVESKLNRLITVLVNKRIILSSEVKFINNN